MRKTEQVVREANRAAVRQIPTDRFVRRILGKCDHSYVNAGTLQGHNMKRCVKCNEYTTVEDEVKKMTKDIVDHLSNLVAEDLKTLKMDNPTNPEIKGYNLSTDYEKLWNLVQDGYRVPAWIVYSKEYDDPIYDLVEVKMAHMSGRFSIGVRGHEYGAPDNNLRSFKRVCEMLELRWINF